MRRWGWFLTASLLVNVAALGQQSSTVQPVSTTPGLAIAPQSTARTPVSIDQVVDQIIEREHALMAFLKDRTPLVETYLQNLTPDTKLGAVPKEDHYFLGRLDMGDVDRRDYLAKETSFQRTLMGGVTKLFRIQYQP